MIVPIKNALSILIAPLRRIAVCDSISERIVSNLIYKKVGHCNFEDVASLFHFHRPPERLKESGAQVPSVKSHRGAPFHLAYIYYRVTIKIGIKFGTINRLAAEFLTQHATPIAKRNRNGFFLAGFDFKIRCSRLVRNERANSPS